MAVTLVTSIKRYVGLSGDAKPVGAPAGSEFKETDTGAKYIVNSAGAWVANPDSVALAAGGNAVTLTGSSIALTSPVPTQNIPKKIITTILNAVTVAAGADSAITSLGLDGTESQVWIAINIDKQPWTGYARMIFGQYASGGLYPTHINDTTLYADLQAPTISLIKGHSNTVTSMIEAVQSAIPLDSTISVFIRNSHATDNATVTVKVIRVWR